MFKNITTISTALTSVITSAASTVEVAVSSLNDLALAGKCQTEIIHKISIADVDKKDVELEANLAAFRLEHAIPEPKALAEVKTA